MNARTALMRTELAQLRTTHAECVKSSKAAATRLENILAQPWRVTQLPSVMREILAMAHANVRLSNSVHAFLARADLIASDAP